MWVTTVTYNGVVSEKLLVEWDQQLEAHDGSASAVPGRGFMFTLWSDGGGVEKATANGYDIAEQIVNDPDLHLAAVETMTDLEYERRADEPTLPELVSAPEVAGLLGGISRQRVHQLQHNAGFPEPLFRLRTGPIWDARAIRKFADNWSRQPGRPAKSA
jgi:hypothetical protein